MKKLLTFILSMSLLLACTNKMNSKVNQDLPKLTKEEALIGYKYVELRGKKYFFNKEEAENAGVPDRIITVFTHDIDQANEYLKDELNSLSENNDSVDDYMLRLMDFQKIDETNINSDTDSIYTDIQLK